MSKRGGARTPPGGGRSWKKISAITGGIVVALTTLASVFDVVPTIVDGAGQTVQSVRRIFGATPPRPYEIDVRTLSVLPQSLFNVMPSQDFLHWFWLRASNRAQDALHLVLEVEVLNGPVRQERVKAAEYTILPGQSLVRSVQPQLVLLKSDFTPGERLTMVWRVRRMDQSVLRSDTLDVAVLPKDVLPWGLLSAHGDAVPREFLVASLAAWVFTPDPDVERRAREVLTRVSREPDEAARTRRWMQLAYESLFTGSGGVAVQARALPFPATSREEIKTPSRVMAVKRASALEAALLLAAHRAALGPSLAARIAMLAFPAAGPDPEGKVFTLAWSSPTGEWEAVELNQASTLSFEDNRKRASPRARQALVDDAPLKEALRERGVFIDDAQRLVALSFWRAQRHYSIRALP